jgi:hypothetical protein
MFVKLLFYIHLSTTGLLKVRGSNRVKGKYLCDVLTDEHKYLILSFGCFYVYKYLYLCNISSSCNHNTSLIELTMGLGVSLPRNIYLFKYIVIVLIDSTVPALRECKSHTSDNLVNTFIVRLN